MLQAATIFPKNHEIINNERDRQGEQISKTEELMNIQENIINITQEEKEKSKLALVLEIKCQLNTEKRKCYLIF